MEIDFDFSDNGIKEFLSNKLKEVQLRNNQLQLKLDERKKANEQVLGCATGQDGFVLVESVWKRIFHHKFIIGINTRFQATESSLVPKDLKVLLTAAFNPIYETYIFNKKSENNCTLNDDCQHLIKDISFGNNTFKNDFIILISMDLPNFQKLSYKINCCLFYDYNGIKTTKLDPIDLSVNEVLEDKTHLQSSNISIENFLSAICSLKKTKFVLTLGSEWNSTIENTFEIYCSLNKLNLTSICRMYFIANNVSPLFDGSIIEVHHGFVKENKNSVDVVIFSMTENSLNFFLHYLHKNIQGATFLPLVNYINSPEDSVSNNERLLRLNKCLGEEMKLVYNFLGEKTNYQLSDMEAKKFRSDLVDLEQKTDLNYLKLFN